MKLNAKPDGVCTKRSLEPIAAAQPHRQRMPEVGYWTLLRPGWSLAEACAGGGDGRFPCFPTNSQDHSKGHSNNFRYFSVFFGQTDLDSNASSRKQHTQMPDQGQSSQAGLGTHCGFPAAAHALAKSRSIKPNQGYELGNLYCWNDGANGGEHQFAARGMGVVGDFPCFSMISQDRKKAERGRQNKGERPDWLGHFGAIGLAEVREVRFFETFHYERF